MTFQHLGRFTVIVHRNERSRIVLADQADRAPRRELVLLPRRMAVLFVVLALAGCASMAAGPGQTPNAPYQQDDPRDTSGMH
jgi:hypothetical protein